MNTSHVEYQDQVHDLGIIDELKKKVKAITMVALVRGHQYINLIF